MQRRSTYTSYVPVDVSLHALAGAVTNLRATYPDLPIHAVVADFEDRLDRLPNHGRRLFALLGSTIGNLDPEGRARFLRNLAATLTPGEGILLGLDLVKDRRRLVEAYDDAAGTTRLFNLNMLNVISRLLGADFDPARFDHVALWNEEHSRIEMRLRAKEAMKVRLSRLETTAAFEEGEEICTEFSTKFRRATIEAEFNTAGLELVGWWTDSECSSHGEYAVVLGVRS
jgi:L-histidine N-alpha-methyltransferase